MSEIDLCLNTIDLIIHHSYGNTRPPVAPGLSGLPISVIAKPAARTKREEILKEIMKRALAKAAFDLLD